MTEVFDNSTVEFDWYPHATAPCKYLTLFGIWMMFDIVVGIFLNGLIIHLFASHKDLRSPTNGFIISISVCDFIACVMEIPLPMIANLSCRWPFGKIGCYYEGFIAYFVGTSSMYCLILVSIDRYIAIAKPLEHQKVTYRVQFLSILFCWANGLFWAGAPLLGWSGYAMEGALTSCSVQWQDKSPSVMSYNILMFLFVLVIPVAIMIFCNFRLYMTIRHVARHGVWNMNDPRAKKKLEVEKRIAKTAIMMIVAWGPYAAVSLISAFGDPSSISPLQATMPALFAKTQVIWNPLIYVVTNKNFREKLPFCKPKAREENAENSASDASSVVVAAKKPNQIEPDVENIPIEEISAGGTTTVSILK